MQAAISQGQIQQKCQGEKDCREKAASWPTDPPPPLGVALHPAYCHLQTKSTLLLVLGGIEASIYSL